MKNENLEKMNRKLKENLNFEKFEKLGSKKLGVKVKIELNKLIIKLLQ